MAYQPTLIDITQEADGWVKKYVLTYELADGRLFNYHCATRRSLDDFKAELEQNGQASKEIMDAIEAGQPAPDIPPAPQNAPDAVCIVARTPRDTLVMEREFRYPLNSWCTAFPAGLVEKGEDIVASACRELEEETGYAQIPGTPVRVLNQASYSSTGLTDETVQIVFLHAEKADVAHTEATELIEVFELPIADIRTFLNTNKLPIGTRAQLVLELFAQKAGI